ncbi:MAG: alternative ribosome rescue aminoacyl-tRNA hydrolase ArfB [Phycisphaerales bacterium]
MPPPEAHPEPDGEPIAPGVRVPPGALRFSASRASGPGGQNVNKRATKIELRIALDDIPIPSDARARLRRIAKTYITSDAELLITSDESRTQLGNRRACLERLRELLVRAMVKPKRRIPTKPSRGAVERRLQEKRERSEKKRRRGKEDL